eukprot:364464-Chlamydomonas_euryale.AAC.9
MSVEEAVRRRHTAKASTPPCGHAVRARGCIRFHGEASMGGGMDLGLRVIWVPNPNSQKGGSSDCRPLTWAGPELDGLHNTIPCCGTGWVACAAWRAGAFVPVH